MRPRSQAEYDEALARRLADLLVADALRTEGDMCVKCTRDLRQVPLKELAVLRDDRTCDAFKAGVDREMEERLAALDLDDPCDEQL